MREITFYVEDLLLQDQTRQRSKLTFMWGKIIVHVYTAHYSWGPFMQPAALSCLDLDLLALGLFLLYIVRISIS